MLSGRKFVGVLGLGDRLVRDEPYLRHERGAKAVESALLKLALIGATFAANVVHVAADRPGYVARSMTINPTGRRAQLCQ